jgi:hypothetical protein
LEVELGGTSLEVNDADTKEGKLDALVVGEHGGGGLGSYQASDSREKIEGFERPSEM